MAKHLVMVDGQWVDVNNDNAPFLGRVARDLDVGDRYETVRGERAVLMEVIEKSVMSGFEIVRSREVQPDA
jgi:hypothetical protein